MAKLIFSLALLLVIGSFVAGQDEMATDIPIEDSTATDPPTPAPTDPPTPAPTDPPATSTTTQAPTTTTTTEAPTTTTTEAPTTTTTEAPTTTTTEAPTTTTTEAPTTTPEPVTTPAPATNSNYSITENDVTCIMIQGAISFTVNYTAKNNKTELATVSVPGSGAVVTGTCNGSDGEQVITVTWGAVNETSSTTMTFNRTKDSWTVADVSAVLYLGKDFMNATTYGKSLDIKVSYGFNPLEIAVNQSFKCQSHIEGNANGTIDGDAYTLPLFSALKDIQFQAYNEIPNEKDFVNSVRCAADNVSDIVPIAVGCALAGLVVIVLIAYLVGRRRRSAAYQSV